LYFLRNKNKEPTLKQIRDAVLQIREGKLPDPEKEPNCGSFFKNPVVDKARAAELLGHFPDMPQWQFGEDEMKISGGWLIEKSGFKGKDFGNLRISPKSALVMISNGKARFSELEDVRDAIIKGVEKNFSVHLEVEPNFVV
jgi:UDP-N-acetylmuramate dehydrogenase